MGFGFWAVGFKCLNVIGGNDESGIVVFLGSESGFFLAFAAFGKSKN